ncbi:transcriptional regulator [Nocardioides sediminis]|uniref:transcriptional regulator n=1 Tax=Nocardioides sediminis TaxID=433648 RepID=UPI000D314495|nr:transcriptional regulator [Nocardioides sediminis]
MHDAPTRNEALALVARGVSLNETARRTGVQRSTIRAWMSAPEPVPRECFRCLGLHPAAARAYTALLGFYLGDGCVSRFRRHTTLRISCDATLPGIIADVSSLVAAVRPSGGAFHVRAPGVIVVSANWKHWPCLFPQHGPGRKHERTIALETWQREVVEAHPADFLRGLFHSDGCRARNWATRVVAGERRRYDYPRWQFTNRSDDIRDLCCWALDLVDVPWRRSGRWVVSVSRREAVGRLDALIGPKT